MKVALLANLQPHGPQADVPWTAPDSWETIQAITIALEKQRHTVIFLEGDRTLYNNLQAVRPDICFNLCQRQVGSARRAHIPAILELLGLPYTGAAAQTLALTPPMTRQILAYHGLLPAEADEQQPTPDSFVMIGVVGHLGPVCATAWDDTGSEAPLHLFPPLSTEPLPINAPVNAPINAPVNAPNEATSPVQPPVTFRPARLNTSQLEALQRITIAAWQCLGCSDMAQFTFCLDGTGRPHLVEVNPLPELHPQQAILPLSAAADGWDYETLINYILGAALRRYQTSPKLPDQPALSASLSYFPQTLAA